MNDFQIKFMKHLSLMQERNVQKALSKYSSVDNVEEILYETTFDLISDLLEMADGYDREFEYKIKILNEYDENIKENPSIELHDKNEEYLKYKKEL